MEHSQIFHELRIRILKAVFLTVCIFFFAFHLAERTNLSVADLGRHITNGRLILTEAAKPLTTNFYSYTMPDFHVINHHWGSGVLYYLWWKWFGFNGASLCYLGLLLIVLGIFYRLARKLSNAPYALFFTLLALPMFASRTEIRPEGLSTLFMGIDLYVLFLYRAGQMSRTSMSAVFLLIQTVWVNCHIFFFMGWVLVAGFFLDALINRRNFDYAKNLFVLGCWSVAVTVFNPAGIEGMLVPLSIFEAYGYRLAENQSVPFMHKRFPQNPLYLHFEIMAGLSVLSLATIVFLRKFRAHFIHFFLLMFFGGLAFKTMRSISVFGFIFIPCMAQIAHSIIRSAAPARELLLRRAAAVISILIIAGSIFFPVHYYAPYRKWEPFVQNPQSIARPFGFFYLMIHPEVWSGPLPAAESSAKFFNELGIRGPVFNNYDIGGYLIFYLFPRERVFVDNRPEAYTVSFFKDIYIPMQEDNAVWKKVDARYHFNAIFFYRHDLTPWGQNFLVQRIQDPEWAPVYVDFYNIIFLRRNARNAAFIERYELPKSMFKWNDPSGA